MKRFTKHKKSPDGEPSGLVSFFYRLSGLITLAIMIAFAPQAMRASGNAKGAIPGAAAMFVQAFEEKTSSATNQLIHLL